MKNKIIKEQGADNIKGYLLYDPIKKYHFFRVHDKEDSSKFEDYELTAEDIEIQLLSDFNALVEYEDGSKAIDYNSKYVNTKK